MTTPSIRLSVSLHRAVKNSEYSISELSREGIERALIDEYVGVCWICGSPIHSKERYKWIDQPRFEETIAGGTDIDWLKNSPFHRLEYHQQYLQTARLDESISPELYYESVGKALAIPPYPIEVCETCGEHLEHAKEHKPLSSDLPAPYLFSGDGIDETQLTLNRPPEPDDYLLTYAADSAAVWKADLRSLLSRDGEEVFWWAARKRQENIVKGSLPVWVEISSRALAHRIGWGECPRPVFDDSLSIAQKFPEDWEPGGFVNHPPGVDRGDELDIDKVDELDMENRCPSCGSVIQDYRNYCSWCFYGQKSCPNNGCSGTLHPKIGEDLVSKGSIIAGCDSDSCRYTEDLTKEEKTEFWKAYRDIFQEIKREIPKDIQG